MDLKGKVALITGGAKIGRAVAEALAQRGCHVALTFRRSRPEANAAAEKCRWQGVRALVLHADVRKDSDARKVLAAIKKEFGRLDVLVNMASFYQKTSGLGDASVWRANMETDLGGTYRLSVMAAPLLRKSKAGRIINFSDWLVASDRPRYREYLPYYVAKAGVKGLTEALALDLAPHVLVNAIAPGPIEGPPGMTSHEKAEVAKSTPLRRWGGADEIAKTVLFFIESDFVTGETLRVDGGRHLY